MEQFIRGLTPFYFPPSSNANRLQPLILLPYHQKRTGNGQTARQIKASRLVAQSTPNLSYIAGAKIGKPPATADLMKLLTAMALFAFMR